MQNNEPPTLELKEIQAVLERSKAISQSAEAACARARILVDRAIDAQQRTTRRLLSIERVPGKCPAQ